MADYSNCKCIACKTEFEPDDDIVVCPECGTPYHRDCWNEYGRCINTELHESGGSWKKPEVFLSREEDRVTCTHCGKSNPKESKFCISCGKSINEDEGYGFNNSGESGRENGTGRLFSVISGDYENADPNEDMGGATLEEVKNFVGKNLSYFIMRFRFFRDTKSKFAPNFVCMLFPQFWFAYRKMWLVSLLIVLATFLLSIPNSLITLANQTDYMLASIQPQLGMMGEGAAELIRSRMLSLEQFVNDNMAILNSFDTVFNFISIALDIVFFMFGNYMYYKHCIKKIGVIRESDKSLMDVQSRLRIAGGTSIGFIFAAIFINIMLTSVLFYVTLII